MQLVSDLAASTATSSLTAQIAAGGETLALQVEETRIPPEAIIELNVGQDGAENWKELDRLSAGQKATAVLMLLLLESDAPLIIDQPESREPEKPSWPTSH